MDNLPEDCSFWCSSLVGVIFHTHWESYRQPIYSSLIAKTEEYALSSAFTEPVLMGEMPRFALKRFSPRSHSESGRVPIRICGASEHRTKERDFGREVSFGSSARLARYDCLPLDCPQQPPLRKKVLHLNHIQ